MQWEKGRWVDYKRATGRILVMELFRILTVVIDTNVIKLHRTQYTTHTHTHTHAHTYNTTEEI